MTDPYDIGTASVANGGTTVTGVGTLWIGNARKNDLFTDPAQGLFARITADATSNTSLTINAWPGAALSGAAYEIIPTGDSTSSAARLRDLLAQMSVVEANGRGLFYRFSDTVTDADPGAGMLRLDAPDPTLATEMYLDNLDANGAAVAEVLDTWDDSTSIIRGQVWLRSVSDPANFHSYSVIGPVVDGTGYRKVTVLHVGGSGALADADELMVSFSATGDAGEVPVLAEGDGIGVDDSDPLNPVISVVPFTGDTGSGGAVGGVPAPSGGDAAANKVLGAGGGWVRHPTPGPHVILQDQKSSGTNGGTFTNGAPRTRDLNTEVYDPHGYCTLSSNQFTLQAGKWSIEWTCPAFRAGYSKTWLYSVTGAANVADGRVAYSDTASNASVENGGIAVVTLGGSTTFEIRHQCTTTRLNDGLGTATSIGGAEVYTTVKITRLD